MLSECQGILGYRSISENYIASIVSKTLKKASINHKNGKNRGQLNDAVRRASFIVLIFFKYTLDPVGRNIKKLEKIVLFHQEIDRKHVFLSIMAKGKGGPEFSLTVMERCVRIETVSTGILAASILYLSRGRQKND